MSLISVGSDGSGYPTQGQAADGWELIADG
jgi:hypothetical protein